MLYPVQVTIATGGAAQTLSSTRQAARWVQLQCPSTNNASGVTVGGQTAKPTAAAGASPGVIIAPGGTQFLPWCGGTTPYDLSSIFINGTTGDVVNVLYFR